MAIDSIKMSGTLFMWNLIRHRSRRTNRRLRPVLACTLHDCVSLEPRLLLSALAETSAAHIEHVAHPKLHHHKAAHHLPRRLTPTQEINTQYALFTAAFNKALSDYVQSISEQSSNTVAVSATVTAAYTPPSAVIQVDDASVFGPAGTFNPSVVASAVIGTVSLGQFTLTGSSGNLLIVSPTPTSVSLPVGTILTASVPTSAQSSALTIFPSFITDSTIQMAINLVKYFNNLPIKLPAKNAPPHTPVQRGAIQAFVYQSVVGDSAQPTNQTIVGTTNPSLQQLLLAIPLPTTPGSDLQIYIAAEMSAIAESHQELTDGITQVFNRNMVVNAQAPANRLGEVFNSSSTSGSSSTGSSGSTSGASSTSGSSTA
jgi:hypothetical protein